MRRIFLILCAIVVLWGALAPLAHAVDWWPLVPCGLNTPPPGQKVLDASYYQPCNKCDLYRLFKNIIDFVFFGVVPVGGTFLVVVAGFLMLLGGANPSLHSKGRAMLKDVFYGVVLIAFSWLIVTSLLRTILRDQNQTTPWWKITCTVRVPSPLPTASPTVSPTPGVVPGQAQAQALINAIGIGAFSTDATCGGNFHARGNIQDISGGKFPAVCSPNCDDKNPTTCAPNGTSVNPAIFDGLIALKNAGFSFFVTSFLTGKHGGGPSHYSGHAVDIVPATSDRAVWQQVRAFLDSRGGDAICEDRTTSADISNCNAVQVDHIHWTK